MHKFLITNEKTGSKKMVQMDEKRELRAAIQSRFNVDNFILQYELVDPDLGSDWLDVENNEDIPDSGKLRIIPEVSVLGNSELSIIIKKVIINTSTSPCLIRGVIQWCLLITYIF